MTIKIIKIAMLVALSFGVTNVALAESTNAELKEINSLSEQGNQAAALEKVNTYLAKNPKDAEALFMKGVILVEQGKRDDAIKAFTDLTEKYPNLPEPYNNLAVLYADKGEYDKARKALETAIKTHPSYATAHENLGDIYARLASEAYGKAFKLDTSNSRAQSKLAMITDLFGGTKSVATATAKEPIKTAETKPVETQKPVEKAKPAETKATAPTNAPSMDNQDAVVVDAVNQWAKAWSAQNVDQYLASYASTFDPRGGQSRKAWENTRRQRISAPKSISVDVSDPKVTIESESEAKVVFRQTYTADSKKPQSTNKTLMMKKEGNTWLINEELIGAR
ncbi:MAG: tetratricopeptide repeat protein [Methylophilus sp.]